MKIAVPYENGNIFGHFGHTERFKLYEVTDGAVTSRELVKTDGVGHGALTPFLRALAVDTVLCGGIGGGAQAALVAAGIRLYAGVSGNADAAVEALLAGTLSYSATATCNHHKGAQGGAVTNTCGAHGCKREQRR